LHFAFQKRTPSCTRLPKTPQASRREIAAENLISAWSKSMGKAIFPIRAIREIRGPILQVSMRRLRQGKRGKGLTHRDYPPLLTFARAIPMKYSDVFWHRFVAKSGARAAAMTGGISPDQSTPLLKSDVGATDFDN
jgi:hypothetical protein